MRNFTIYAVSFIVAVGSTMPAMAELKTISSDSDLIIQQNRLPSEVIENTGTPVPAETKPAVKATKSSSNKTSKKSGDTAKNKKAKTAKNHNKQPTEVTETVTMGTGAYVLGGLGLGGLVALAFSGGGGGGGSGGDSGGVDYTAETNRNYGVKKIKADVANSRGYAGSGVNVAVVDDGIQLNPDLDTNILAGYDFTTNDSDPYISSALEHGTWVSGVIAASKNGVGMHGVAYNAKIIPLRVFDDLDQSSFTWLANAINYAKNNTDAKIVNLSLGSYDMLSGSNPSGFGTVYYKTPLSSSNISDLGGTGGAYVTALKNAEAAGKVIVFAAGNEGFNSVNSSIGYYSSSTPSEDTYLGSVTYSNFLTRTGASSSNYANNQSSLDGRLPVIAGTNVGSQHWLNVVATDQNNVIASFSNGCGDTKNFCLAAPGVSIVTTGSGNGLDTVDGTSFSAPHVSGSVAVLMSAFPSLTPAQVVDLLLTTSTDLGAPGVDDVYGHGLVNLDAATQPVGITSVTSASGSTVAMPSGLLSSSFGDSLSSGKVAFTDSYGRVYNTPVSGLRDEIRPLDLTDKFAAFNTATAGFSGLSDVVQAGSVYNWSASDTGREAAPNATLTSLGYMKGGSTSPLFGYQGSDTVRAGFALNPAIYSDQDVNSMQLSFATGDESFLRFGSAFSKNYGSNETTPVTGDNKTMGYNVEYARHLTDNLDVSAFTGLMREQGQVLGSMFSGAFEVDNANSTFAGIGATYGITPSLFITGNYMYAATDVNTANSDFAMNNLTSDSTLLGIVANDNFVSGDVSMLSLRQPLRNKTGSAGLTAISGYTDSGSYDVQSTNYDLTPSGREQTLEFAYSVPTGLLQSVTFTVGASQDYANIKNQDESHALAVYRLKF